MTSRRSRRHIRSSGAGIVIFLIIAFIILQFVGLRPLQKVQSTATFFGTASGEFLDVIGDFRSIRKESEQLHEQVQALASNHIDFKQLEDENRKLRALLEYKNERQDLNLLPANVIARSIGLERAQMLIDLGSVDGVREGLVVVVDDGMVIGKIISTRDNSSVVRLLTDHRSKIAAKVGASETIGVGEGTKGALLNFNFIPQSISLDVNNLVLTSGLEDGIPPNLIIGVVTGLEEDDTAPFKSATIEPLIDARYYSNVAIVEVPEL